MTRGVKTTLLLQLLALSGGAAAIGAQKALPATVDACAWCTGPYICNGNVAVGFEGCNVVGGHLCSHTGPKCGSS